MMSPNINQLPQIYRLIVVASLVAIVTRKWTVKIKQHSTVSATYLL